MPITKRELSLINKLIDLKMREKDAVKRHMTIAGDTELEDLLELIDGVNNDLISEYER